jgi:hypothetical protein
MCFIILFMTKNLKIRSIPWIPSALSSYLVPILSLSNLSYLYSIFLSSVHLYIQCTQTVASDSYERTKLLHTRERERERESIFKFIYLFIRHIKGSVEKVIKTVLNNIYFHLIEPKHFDSPLNDYFIILNQFWATKQSKAWKYNHFSISKLVISKEYPMKTLKCFA